MTGGRSRYPSNVAGRDVTLERYDLVERIASGGMGEVFRAVAYGAHGFSKNLAVKRILPRFAEDKEFERRFVEEAKLAVSLTHANIVQVLDFGHMAGSLYLAMEYIDGLDTSALLDGFEKRGEPIPIGALLHIGTEVCKGLDFAHRRSVVHRDVSPSNLLLSRAGEVKIADFGIARAVSGTTSQIETSRIIGKLRYMSPEQIQGGRVDGQSDLFALGIVLWELATCEQLITARDLDSATEQVCNMLIPRVQTRRPDIPDDLDKAIANMLERDRSKRCQSARALLPMLAKCAYALDPVPTAFDVADAVELAIGATERQESGELDAAILAELGGAAIASPDRVTRARGKHDSEGARTITIFRAGVDARGLPQWQTGTAQPVTVPAKPQKKEATIDVAAVSRVSETEVTPRRGARLGALIGLLLAGALLTAALYAGLRRNDEPSGNPSDEDPDAAIAATANLDSSVPIEVAAAADAAAVPIDVEIESRPKGAEVLRAGVSLGVTPLTTKLAPGVHELTLRKKDYRDEVVALTVSAQTPAKVSERLERDEGTIAIFSHPWAYVYYRGRKVGQTPIRRLKLPTGSHRLTLENPVLKKKKTVRVKVPRSKPYRFNL